MVLHDFPNSDTDEGPPTALGVSVTAKQPGGGDNTTVENCTNQCGAESYPIAGVSWGNECCTRSNFFSSTRVFSLKKESPLCQTVIIKPIIRQWQGKTRTVGWAVQGISLKSAVGLTASSCTSSLVSNKMTIPYLLINIVGARQHPWKHCHSYLCLQCAHSMLRFLFFLLTAHFIVSSTPTTRNRGLRLGVIPPNLMNNSDILANLGTQHLVTQRNVCSCLGTGGRRD